MRTAKTLDALADLRSPCWFCREAAHISYLADFTVVPRLVLT